MPPRDHFSLSNSSRCRTSTKALCGSRVSIPTTQAGSLNPHSAGPLRSLPPLLLDTAQQQDSAICESITLPDHSHVLNIIMPPIQRMSLQMEADISARQSQQPCAVIWAVTR